MYEGDLLLIHGKNKDAILMVQNREVRVFEERGWIQESASLSNKKMSDALETQVCGRVIC